MGTEYAGCVNCWNGMLDGQDNCPCDDCDKQEGVLGAGTAPDKWVPDCDETAKQFTQEADATVESVRVDNGV